ncbi:GNAT family protein [Kiloniella laminariae]|uniref:GNAT family protein n=1 Tax=Kiloniella laminariae TaxID=454162 RepID=A0ABT4LL68_9PROT|nr:GNAT family protein [Kiloniella laminariae]MCZ4281822.1 GNAT family protein [Kiloniella laminariae]
MSTIIPITSSVNTSRLNVHGQPIGPALDSWIPRSSPPQTSMAGTYCRLEILSAEKHGQDLFQANTLDTSGKNWSYLAYGPFETLASYQDWIREIASTNDPLFHAIIDQSNGKAVGVASYLRITPSVGSIEVGHINFSPALQRNRMATEAMYLMMKRVFTELGYRRYEWKCDALNAGSIAAAKRLGFTFEGVFRQATVYKGRNRDTAWFSILDKEWPALDQAFKQWLAPENFDVDANQKISLSALTTKALEQNEG